MSNESTINCLFPIALIDDTFQSQLSFDYEMSLHHEQDTITGTMLSLIYEQDIDTQTTSSIIDEQKIQIESNTPSNAHAKSNVWDYFTKPYGPPKSLKTKCSICKIEISYHGSPSSLKHHLNNKHKRQLQQIPK
ncbi:8216_t:CDS:2 [Diversispora eburnea]|uniref:8216_t:CDS:1 n=1 Tax=Diversispora eburnea TaxID=1213867 RepID=A0A9N9FEZ1_9GLOM|nr:8216_t:CDS:2 [Diversispora eburnea]